MQTDKRILQDLKKIDKKVAHSAAEIALMCHVNSSYYKRYAELGENGQVSPLVYFNPHVSF